MRKSERVKQRAEKWARARLDMVYSGKASINEYSDIIDAFMAGVRHEQRRFDRKHLSNLDDASRLKVANSKKEKVTK